MKNSMCATLLSLMAMVPVIGCAGGLSSTQLNEFKQRGKLAALGAPALMKVWGEPGQRDLAIEKACHGRERCSTEALTWMWYEEPHSFGGGTNAGFLYPVGVDNRKSAQRALVESAKANLGVELVTHGGPRFERLAQGVCYELGFSSVNLVWCDSRKEVRLEEWQALGQEGISVVFIGVSFSTAVVRPGKRVQVSGFVWIIDTETGKTVFKPGISPPKAGEVSAERLAPFFPHIDHPEFVWDVQEAAARYGEFVTRDPEDIDWLNRVVTQQFQAAFDQHLDDIGD